MQAFHGDLKIKKVYLDRVLAHAKADEIVKGKYWEAGKGCAVGCTIHSSNHNAYETELGIPEWLARVEDTLFEGMPTENAKKWPAKFLKAIKPGADLEPVKVPFIVFILNNALKNMKAAKFDRKNNPQVVAAQKQVESAVKEVIRCHKKGLDLSAAESAARSAARSAASAARSAASAAEAAESAARSAASAARSAASAASAARSAAWSAVWSAAEAAWSAAHLEYSEELLRLLRRCKPIAKKGEK